MKTSKGHICKGCKNPLPCRTPGCPQCKWRHNYNVSIGKEPKRRRCCKKCGTPYTNFNMECDLCRKRHRVKLIREAGDEHEPKTCAGCGGKTNQFTPGCKTCMKRRWSRAKKANLPTRRLTCSKCGYAMIYRECGVSNVKIAKISLSTTAGCLPCSTPTTPPRRKPSNTPAGTSSPTKTLKTSPATQDSRNKGEHPCPCKTCTISKTK